MGWLTTEELVWDDKGKLATHAPSTYKIPATGDVPAHFNVALWPEANRETTSRQQGRRRAAVHAGDQRVGGAAGGGRVGARRQLRSGTADRKRVRMAAPATAENVLKAMQTD